MMGLWPNNNLKKHLPTRGDYPKLFLPYFYPPKCRFILGCLQRNLLADRGVRRHCHGHPFPSHKLKGDWAMSRTAQLSQRQMSWDNMYSAQTVTEGLWRFLFLSSASGPCVVFSTSGGQ